MTQRNELWWSESEQAVIRKTCGGGYTIVDSPNALGWFPGPPPVDAVRYVPVPADESAVVRMAYAMAREHWSQTRAEGQEWNEREDWQVPSLVYMAQARAGLAALMNPNLEEENHAR